MSETTERTSPAETSPAETSPAETASTTGRDGDAGEWAQPVITKHTTFLLACVGRDRVMQRYSYKVKEGLLPHAAFRTRRELVRWMGERGLTPGRPIPPVWTFETIEVEGGYQRVSHMSRETFEAVGEESELVGVSRRLSNGDFVEAIITEEDGVRQVHFLNPNVMDRTTFGRDETAAVLREVPDAFQETWMEEVLYYGESGERRNQEREPESRSRLRRLNNGRPNNGGPNNGGPNNGNPAKGGGGLMRRI